ncbi:DNA-directed RNA polymerase omega subunit [Clostridiaceae bacterium JG1575]|nr:DNA-directed RNA polymerase omega subunit [Clostridiaceae bacterium JG1575]
MEKKTMINPSITDLLEKVDNRYRLVTVTAKRARQLIAKQPMLVEDGDYDKPLTTAIEEVNEGLVHYESTQEPPKVVS